MLEMQVPSPRTAPGPGSPAVLCRTEGPGPRCPRGGAAEGFAAQAAAAAFGLPWSLIGAGGRLAGGRGGRGSDKGARGLQIALIFYDLCEDLAPFGCSCPGYWDRLNSLAAQLFTALVSLAQAQRRMYGESGGDCGEDSLPARGSRSQRRSVMTDPGVVVPEDAALGRGEAAAQGISRALPFGKARGKAALMPVPPSSSVLMLE